MAEYGKRTAGVKKKEAAQRKSGKKRLQSTRMFKRFEVPGEKAGMAGGVLRSD